MPKKIIYLFLVPCILQVAVCLAGSKVKDPFTNPFYIGLTGGYGSTTWGQLVPSQSKASLALSMSTPVSVSEGGAIWGVYVGYEIIPTFAVEGSYTHYPTANVNFDSMSLFTFDHNGRTSFPTKTETTGMAGKFMLVIPKTTVRAFSTVGVAGVHRSDVIADRWRISPAFSVGLNYNMTEHIMAEVGVDFTGGYGESELDPVQDYIPFLYSGFLRLAYRF